jgi:2'-5' RNA ligase
MQGRGEASQLFGVLAPVPEPHAGVIQRWRQELGDPAAHIVPPHITLLGPISAAPKRFDSFLDHLEVVTSQTEPIEIHLSGTASFRPVTPTTFVEIAGGRSEIEALAAALNGGDVRHEATYEFRPHVTIVNNVPDTVLDRAEEVLADFEARFRVDAIGAYSPDEAGRWTVRRWFELRG